jgi:hypothetical protein
MRRETLIGIIIILVAIAGVYAFWGKDMRTTDERGNQDQPQTLEYRNDTYGYAFTFPNSVSIQEYTQQTVSVGTPTNGGFDAAADVSVVESGNEGGYENFEAFVFERGRTLCAADGPNESIDCTGIAERNEITTSTGLAAAELYFTLVRTNLQTGDSTESRFGPVYAFNIAPNVPNADFAALLVYQPLASALEQPDAALVRNIAESITIDRVETDE